MDMNDSATQSPMIRGHCEMASTSGDAFRTHPIVPAVCSRSLVEIE